MDRIFVFGDTNDYVKELLDKIDTLSKENEMQDKNSWEILLLLMFE